MPDSNDFSKQLRELRKKAGLNQEELADLLDVSIATVRRWEWGTRFPRTNELARIAAALNVTEAELLNGPSEDTREIKLMFDKEGEFSMQMFNMVNMSGTGADQRLVCVSKDRIATGFSLTTAGMDKDTARQMFMNEVDQAFENAWTQQEGWRAEKAAGVLAARP